MVDISFFYDSQFYDVVNKTGYNYLDIKKNFSDISKYLNIYFHNDLNNFYKKVQSVNLSINYQNIYYNDYYTILESYRDLEKKYIEICIMYQGMGHYVALLYNIDDNYYIFACMGGSNSHEREMNVLSLNKLKKIKNNFIFNTFTEAHNYMHKFKSKYIDDCSFMNDIRVIKLD